MKKNPKIHVKRTILEKKTALHYLLYGRYQPKIFCIGFNKTGTTSIYHALTREGIKVGDQPTGERLLLDYINGNFDPIVQYCKTARAFQDVPFSLPDTYRYLYKAFPNAKFILSVRDSADQWFESQLRFAEKRLGKVPSLSDLKEWDYCWKGWSLHYHEAVFGKAVEFEDREVKIRIYNQHKIDVKNFFRDKQKQLLVLNVGSEGSFLDFCSFLGIHSKYQKFPWAKKTLKS